MSTSISFALSAADQEAPMSKSYFDLRKPSDADNSGNHLKPLSGGKTSSRHKQRERSSERRHTGSGVVDRTAFFESGSSKLRKWRHQPQPDSLSDSRSASREDEEDEDEGEDFYDEVDQRMSRCSLEYPEHQAQYIDRWLNESIQVRSRSFDENSTQLKGNVIGIRGFSSDQSIVSSQNRYNKLKNDYMRLQSNHNKLKSHFDEALRKFKKTLKSKDADLERLKTLLLGQTRKKSEAIVNCDKCQGRRSTAGARSIKANNDNLEQLEQTSHELKRMELRLQHRDEEHKDIVRGLKAANEKLQRQLDGKCNEMEKLQSRIELLSLEPQNREMFNLHKELTRLREANSADLREFHLLKDDYARLQAQMMSICRDQQTDDKQKNEDSTRVLIELYRLQVKQPKLEGIIETERQIKGELQGRVVSLERDNQQLKEQLDRVNEKLNLARSRSKASESIEIEALQCELDRWKEKYRRLTRDKLDGDELLRQAREKVAHLDAKYHNEINLVRESRDQELEASRRENVRLMGERDSLLTKVDELRLDIARHDSESRQLEEELRSARGDLERMKLIERELINVNELRLQAKELEHHNDAMRQKLEASEAKSGCLADEVTRLEAKVETSERQVNELRRRLEAQQRANDELRKTKDKELARLRVDLNFEQYNRQMALRGIEKELKSSLKELESMKYRSSVKRFQPNGGGGGGGQVVSAAVGVVVNGATTDGQTPSFQETTTPASGRCVGGHNRVRFEEMRDRDKGSSTAQEMDRRGQNQERGQ